MCLALFEALDGSYPRGLWFLVQAYLILLHFSLLCFTKKMHFLQNGGLWQACIE